VSTPWSGVPSIHDRAVISRVSEILSLSTSAQEEDYHVRKSFGPMGLGFAINCQKGKTTEIHKSTYTPNETEPTSGR